MSPMSWLETARTLYSLSQSGLAYSKNPFDLDRYRQLQQLSAEIVSQHTELTTEEIQNNFSLQAGYATPKVDIRGAVIEDGKVLMVRELADGKWSLPGGWADLGDSPAAMVIREIEEESGYIVMPSKLVGVFNNNLIEPLDFYHAYKLVFLCQRVGGQARTSFESLDVNWFPIRELPELSLNRTPQRVLEEIYAHLEEPERPTFYE